MPESPSRLYVYWQDMRASSVDTEVIWCLQQEHGQRSGVSPLVELAQSLNRPECIPVLSAIQARMIYQPVASKRQSVRDQVRLSMLATAVDSSRASAQEGNHIHWHEDQAGLTAVVIATDHWQRFQDLFGQLGFTINRVHVDADILTPSTAPVGASWQHGLIFRQGQVHRFGLHKAMLSNNEVIKALVPFLDIKECLWLGNKPAVSELTEWHNELAEVTDCELFSELVQRHNPDAAINLKAPAKDKGIVGAWVVAIVLTFGLMMASWHLYLMELDKQIVGLQQQQRQHLQTSFPDMNWSQEPVQEIRSWLRKTPMDPPWLQYLQALQTYQLSVAGPYKRETGKDLDIESMHWDAGTLTINLRPEIDLASVLIVNDDARSTIQWRPAPPDRGQILISLKQAQAALSKGVE